jgi:hypothetical protein
VLSYHDFPSGTGDTCNHRTHTRAPLTPPPSHTYLPLHPSIHPFIHPSLPPSAFVISIRETYTAASGPLCAARERM